MFLGQPPPGPLSGEFGREGVGSPFEGEVVMTSSWPGVLVSRSVPGRTRICHLADTPVDNPPMTVDAVPAFPGVGAGYEAEAGCRRPPDGRRDLDRNPTKARLSLDLRMWLG
ncbi:hypothetical protein GCM10027614_50770 [Micromonospora vulcania]